MGVWSQILGLIRPSKDVKPDELDVWLSSTHLKAVRAAFDDRMDLMDKRLDEYKRRLAKCEYTYTSEIHELEAELDAVQKENEGLTQHVASLEAPADSREAEAAKVLLSWGYSDQQILKAAELLKQNEALVEGFLEEGGDEPISTMMKKNRILIETFLKPKLGQPAATKSSGFSGNPGIDLKG